MKNVADSINNQSETIRRGGGKEWMCSYACDRACSLHSLMSLMRLLYLKHTQEETYFHCKIYMGDSHQYTFLSTRSYPLMFTNRSSAALWMWKTSSLNRQRQVELCSASFHKDSAAASLFSTEWQRMKPTGRREGTDIKYAAGMKHVDTAVSTVLTNDPFLHGVQRQVFTWHLQKDLQRVIPGLSDAM